MKEFKENKISEVTATIAVILFLTTLIVYPICFLICSIFYDLTSEWVIIPFFISLPINVILLLVSEDFSQKEKYSKDFVNYIKSKLKKAKTIQELKEIEDEIWFYAVDKQGIIKLKYPLEIKELLKEIKYKSEILKNI